MLQSYIVLWFFKNPQRLVQNCDVKSAIALSTADAKAWRGNFDCRFLKSCLDILPQKGLSFKVEILVPKRA